MEQTTSLFKLVNGNKDCEWIYRFWANPGRPWGGIVPPLRSWPLSRRSGRVPALPYPPLRSPQCTSLDCGPATSFSAVLARRLALAVASFTFRAAQMASARPASLLRAGKIIDAPRIEIIDGISSIWRILRVPGASSVCFFVGDIRRSVTAQRPGRSSPALNPRNGAAKLTAKIDRGVMQRQLRGGCPKLGAGYRGCSSV